jgi:hypothetical protein
MEDEIVPDGFLRLSDAVNRLAQGIWGGMPRPAPLRAIKPEHKRGGSLGFGPWKEEAGKLLRTAATEGKLPVYISGVSQPTINNSDPQPVVLPTAVLSRMIPTRGGLSDHPIRISLKIAGGDQKIMKLLQVGLLLVRAEEFNKWYRLERAKGKWPSQRSRLKRREGRPSKLTDALKKAIFAAMREQKISIAELRRRLVASGRTDVPSLDTLERMVDQLYRETGEPVLRRTRRFRRKRV